MWQPFLPVVEGAGALVHVPHVARVPPLRPTEKKIFFSLFKFM